MEDFSTQLEFNGRVPIDPLLEIIQQQGAVALHNFLSAADLSRMSRSIQALPFSSTERTSGPTHHPAALHYRYAHDNAEAFYEDETIVAPPQPLFHAAQQIDRYIGEATQSRWKPNELIAHQIEVGEYKPKHLDQATALGYIALLTAAGSQEFYFQRNNGNVFNVTMNPGTLIIFRGFTAHGQHRPYHWTAPAKTPRFALSLLQSKMNRW